MSHGIPCPYGTAAPRALSVLAVTATASAEKGHDAGGKYVFRVTGDDVFILFGPSGVVTTPTSSTGFPLKAGDVNPAVFDIPAGSRFKAICASTETANLYWYRACD